MYKNIGIATLIILLALAVGFIFGSNWNNKSEDKPSEPTNTTTLVENSESDSDKDVKGLVNYALPDGWSESACPSSSGSVYFRPNGAPTVDCGNNPDLIVKLSTSGQNITECSQIQDVKEVRKHVCKSLYINDLRSLVTETEHLSSSVYGRETSVKTYYIDSGSGIVKATYTNAGANLYQPGFDELVNSISAK